MVGRFVCGLLMSLVIILQSCCSTAFARDMTPYEALQIIAEYTMDFGKYSAQGLLDISADEANPAYNCLYFGYDDENHPLKSYAVDLCSGDNGSPYTLSVTEKDYSGEILIYFGILGTGDIAWPYMCIFGTDILGEIVKSIVLKAEKEYRIDLKKSDHSGLNDGEFFVFVDNLFQLETDLLRELVSNKRNLLIDITFNNNETIHASCDFSNDKVDNPVQSYIQALTDAGFLDSDGTIQSDIALMFPEMAKSSKKYVTVVSLSDKHNKGYSSFGEKYGLEQTSKGKCGTSNSGRPWVSVNVKNAAKDKSVDGFDIVYYGTSVYGDVLSVDSEDAKLVYETVVKNIKPGSNFTTDRFLFYDPSQQPKMIHAAIRRIHFSDGTLIEIPLRDLLFFDYEIVY